MPKYDPNPEQAAILGHPPSRSGRVLAGPGTGKSATVVALLERLVATEEPPKVKLLTFTRAATAELAEKVGPRRDEADTVYPPQHHPLIRDFRPTPKSRHRRIS